MATPPSQGLDSTLESDMDVQNVTLVNFGHNYSNDFLSGRFHSLANVIQPGTPYESPALNSSSIQYLGGRGPHTVEDDLVHVPKKRSPTLHSEQCL